MNLKYYLSVIILTCILFPLLLFIYDGRDFATISQNTVRTPVEANHSSVTSNKIPIVTVLCKDHRYGVWEAGGNVHKIWKRQKEQIITLLGSILYLTYLDIVNVIIFVDSESTRNELKSLLRLWPNHYRQRLNYEIRFITANILSSKYLNKWRQCSWTKYFMDELMPDYDSVVYIDTDMVLLGPVEDSEKVFSRMDSDQAIGCGPEYWYKKEDDSRTIAGQYGLNTGTLFQNLTKIRQSIPNGLGNAMLDLKNFSLPPRNSQDTFNGLIHDKQQHLLLEISTRYNFLVTACVEFAPECLDCQEDGILFLHGADSTFYRKLDHKVKGIYDILKKAAVKMKYELTDIKNEMESKLLHMNKYRGPLIYMCNAYQFFDSQLLKQIRKKAS